MHRTRLLQLGDVHFPKRREQRLADIQDEGLAPIVDASTPNLLKGALRAVVRRLSSVDHLLVCGDMTDKGVYQGYLDCLAHLDQALGLSDPDRFQSIPVHVVPGNHDIDRRSATVSGDLLAKFDLLASAWEDIGRPVLATRTAVVTEASSGLAKVAFASLNSCIGCGERRFFPQSIQDRVGEVIDGHHGQNSGDDLLFEELDTPAFQIEHIEQLEDALLDMQASVVVVVAHHNILPQATPRFKVYTDLVNGGLVRSRLASLKGPVLYLHGHIHDGPIEIVNQVMPNEGVLVCISAPELIDGFNEVDIYFTNRGVPLGCVIRAYRRVSDGGILQRDESLIPFRPGIDLLAETVQEVRAAVGFRAAVRGHEVLSSLGLPKSDVFDALQELRYAGFVDIMNPTADASEWMVQPL